MMAECKEIGENLSSGATFRESVVNPGSNNPNCYGGNLQFEHHPKVGLL